MTAIKAMREQANYSQNGVAKALGIDQSAVSHWEIGDSTPSIKNLKKLAVLFDCKIDDLLKEVN